MNRRFALMFALGLSTLATVAHVDSAEAGRYRFGGSGSARVHVRVPASAGVSVTYSSPTRVYSGRTWSTGGHVYVGPRYAPRYSYYRPYYYYYRPVPSYYGYYEQSYYPVAPAPSGVPAQAPGVAVSAPAPQRALPKFGVGLFAGGISVQDVDQSSDVGLLGRFRLTQGLLIEGELGKTSYVNDLRVDRRLGASLVYEIGAQNRFAPYILAGLGAQQAEVSGGDFTTTQNFGELGVGLRLALTPNIHLLADVRAGSRASVAGDQVAPAGTVARVVTPPTADVGKNEEYTRARVAAALYF